MKGHEAAGPAARTIGLAALAGWLLSLTGVPLGWMIGAMLATSAASLSGASVRVPARAQHVVRALVGTMLGAALTPELLRSVPLWWPSLLCLLAAFAIMFAAGYLVLRRIGGFGRPAAVLCAVPGGIAEMILLAEAAGAGQTRVSIVHALRIALTILVMPVLLGLFGWDGVRAAAGPPAVLPLAWFAIGLCVLAGLLARHIRGLPAPLVLVPLVVGGAIQLSGALDFAMPDGVTVLVQVFIGINVGSRFSGMAPSALLQALAMALSVVAVQIATAAGVALLTVTVTGWDPLAQLLAYAPGGLAEMSLIAVAVDTDPAFVGLHHMFRVIVALIAAPLLLSWLAGRPERSENREG